MKNGSFLSRRAVIVGPSHSRTAEHEARGF
jgi:hypothetical protein